MGAGIIGAEVDFGYSPNFFEDTRGAGDFKFGDSNVTTLMGNLIIGAPIGRQQGPGVRPYASGGMGLIRTHIDGTRLLSDLNANDLGVNIGGGVVGFFSDNFGLRGDVRYSRALQDNEADNDVDLSFGSFDFWRATVGAIFRW